LFQFSAPPPPKTTAPQTVSPKTVTDTNSVCRYDKSEYVTLWLLWLSFESRD